MFQRFRSLHCCRKKWHGHRLCRSFRVIPYLSNEEVVSLGRDLQMQVNIKFWVVDYFGPFFYKFWKKNMKIQLKNSPFKFQVDDWNGFYNDIGPSSDEASVILNSFAPVRTYSADLTISFDGTA